MIWKILPNGKKKGRPIVNIRGLNDLIVYDVYLLSLQVDIILKLRNYRFISIYNALSFFY